MKKFYFEKAIKEDGNISILATANGWTNEYTSDGEVDTSLEYTVNNEITQEEAEKILNEYGWAICQECGSIYIDGSDCDDCQNINWQRVDHIKEYIKSEIEENGLENNQIELEFCNLGEYEEIETAAKQLGYKIETGEGQGMYWIYKDI